ncbi:MAG: phosphate ABC transporter ATP-binding protein [Vulcanisaeta sp.]|jgi:phosphate transport system ATP-binding protein|uniref:phosphate ABC transporter ATP-binding protein n=1 Tax=Vulcanisaeta sp. TaxID=2020871 RepID=UPI003D0A3565
MEDPRPIIEIQRLNVWIGNMHILKDINGLSIPRNCVFAIMGPSGSGKSTLLKTINRIIELYKGVRVEGKVTLDGEDIFSMDPVVLRRRVGMVFQQPNPFPHMSIYDNIAYPLRANGIIRDRTKLNENVRYVLERVHLWDEVKDRLKMPAGKLSGGQQQRLVIARALALRPEVLLMDEPTSMIDVVNAKRIEELILELSRNITIIVVTHNSQQAARISNYVAFLYNGKLIEWGPTEKIFSSPLNKLTEMYVVGKV